MGGWDGERQGVCVCVVMGMRVQMEGAYMKDWSKREDRGQQ